MKRVHFWSRERRRNSLAVKLKIGSLVYCSTETKSVIFLSDFSSFASFRPQVRKANVTEKCVRNANIFPFSFPFISILDKKMIVRINFFIILP